MHIIQYGIILLLVSFLSLPETQFGTPYLLKGKNERFQWADPPHFYLTHGPTGPG